MEAGPDGRADLEETCVVTVTLTELMVNAVNAALQTRQVALATRLARFRSMPESASRDFTIETIETAIRDTRTAYLSIAAALDEPEYPADMTVARLTESEYRLMDGNR